MSNKSGFFGSLLKLLKHFGALGGILGLVLTRANYFSPHT
jgi:hypothetical protein